MPSLLSPNPHCSQLRIPSFSPYSKADVNSGYHPKTTSTRDVSSLRPPTFPNYTFTKIMSLRPLCYKRIKFAFHVHCPRIEKLKFPYHVGTGDF